MLTHINCKKCRCALLSWFMYQLQVNSCSVSIQPAMCYPVHSVLSPYVAMCYPVHSFLSPCSNVLSCACIVLILYSNMLFLAHKVHKVFMYIICSFHAATFKVYPSKLCAVICTQCASCHFHYSCT